MKEANSREYIETEVIETDNITIQGKPVLSEKDAAALQPIIKDFMASYAAKPADVTDETWLIEKLQAELPDKPVAEIRAMGQEILQEVARFDENLASVRTACDNGQTKEGWFRDKAQEAAIGISVNDYGAYLQQIDTALSQSNAAMAEAVLTKSGAINMNPNLDGFIAEQQTANSFNQAAALKNSPYRAEVLVPDGEGYGKNSVDIVIRDTRKMTQNIVRRYQLKFGQDAEATARYIQHGDYRGQRVVVPEGQSEGVQHCLDTQRKVSEYIESPDGVRSKPISKERAKRMQEEVQQGKGSPNVSWNSYNTRELAFQIGKQAAFTGVVAAAIGTGFHLASKYIQGEKIDGEEVVATALTTGADAGIKAAATGALKVGVERGLVPVLRGIPNNGLVAIACTGIESAKILGQFADGKISGMEAVDKMGQVAVSTVYGLSWGAKGAAIGAVALSWIPLVGPVIGGFIGGTIGYMAGSKVGSAIYSGAKKIGKVAKSVAKTAWNGVKAGARAIGSGIKSVASTILSWF
jgi:hypothetical protein